MKKVYKVNTDGLEWASVLAERPLEDGAEVELELSKETETAVVAAGWVEPMKKKAKED